MFNSRPLNYKSYRSIILTIPLGSNGSDPQDVQVKVFNTKKPKAEVSVWTGSFSESRGCGFSSAKKLTFTDSETVGLCVSCLTNPSAISGLIDKIMETQSETNPVVRKLARWYLLSQQESPCVFIENERREQAFSNKKFSVGDRVVYRSRHSDYTPIEVTITGEQFDWRPYLGGGWRYTANGITADQINFQPIEQLVGV